MMSSKTKTGLSQTPVSKPSPTTTRSKLGSSASLNSNVDSPYTNPLFSADRASPKTVTLRPVSRSLSRVSTPPDKSQPRINKPSELQVQFDLRKAKEKLALSEREKGKALNDLKDTNEKLQQALVAQKPAEESSEIKKSRAIEMGQAGIEELERVKQELTMVIETKNQALAHATDAAKNAEIHAEKAEFLSAELVRLKGMLELKTENESSENGIIVELRCELGLLRDELEKAKGFEQEFIEKEKTYEKNVVDLKSELESLQNELDKAKAREREWAEKEKSYENSLTLMEQKLLESKTCEHRLMEKEKSYEKTIEELELELVSLQQNFEKVKASEQDLVDREKSHNITITELKSDSDSLKQELKRAKGFEQKLVEKEAFYEQTLMALKSETDLLNQELENAKKIQEKSNEKNVRDLELELHSLKEELKGARSFRDKLTLMEESYEWMNVELEAAKTAESYALSSLNEWKRKAEELECKVAETTRLEISATESLELVMKQLESKSNILQETECQVSVLKEKASLLGISLVKREEELVGSLCRLRKANEDVKEAVDVIESMRYELEFLKKEKNNLINELEILKKQEDKSKMAMESLASALHEVSAEAREVKERLLSSQDRNEKYEAMLEHSKREMNLYKIESDVQMEDMKVIMKASNDKYEMVLDEVKQECDHLTNTLQVFKLEHENNKAEWEAKELKLLNCVKRLEENETSLTERSKSIYEESKAEWEEKELQLVNVLKQYEEERSSMEKEIMRLDQLVRETEEKACFLQEEKDALKEAKADCLKLKDDLHGKEIELENLKRENGFLECEAKMWENYKCDIKFSAEMEMEESSLDDEVESKADDDESLDLNENPFENEYNSDSKQQQQQKKKKMKKKRLLLHKFGNLLKKGISNPK